MTPDGLLDLFVLSPVGMVTLDDEGRVGVANPSAKRLLHPFLRSGDLSPFFDVLSPWVGDLGSRARAFEEPRGVVGVASRSPCCCRWSSAVRISSSPW